MDRDAYLSEMVTHYLVCAAWSSSHTPDPENDINHCVPLDELDADWSPEAQARALEDCAGFYDGNRDDLEGMDPEQAGHDFWLTRNGHGAGFWDRGLGERGRRLSDATRPYGDCIAELGDDGLIYLA